MKNIKKGDNIMDKVKDRKEETRLLFNDMKLFYGKYLTNDDIDRYIEYLGEYDYQDLYKCIKNKIYNSNNFPTICQMVREIEMEHEPKMRRQD